MYFFETILAIALCLVSIKQYKCFQTGKSLAKPYITLEGPFGQIQCIKQCLQRNSCLMIEYNRRYLRCRLGNTQEIVNDDDAMSMTITKSMMTEYQDLSGECANHSCPLRTRCIGRRSTFLCILDVCPTTWKFYRNHCYFFSTEARTWDDAKNECKRMNSSLAKINDLEENTWLINRFDSFESRWLGGNDKAQEGTWVWDMDSSIIGLDFWDTYEPSNNGGIENCMTLNNNHKWNDGPCHIKLKYICENK